MMKIKFIRGLLVVEDEGGYWLLSPEEVRQMFASVKQSKGQCAGEVLLEEKDALNWRQPE